MKTLPDHFASLQKTLAVLRRGSFEEVGREAILTRPETAFPRPRRSQGGEFLAWSARLAQSSRVIRFDTIYTALGLRGRSELATRLGAEHDEDGMLIVDDHQRTSVPGLCAAGDVVAGLTQIGVAMGQAAVAASTINSTLERRLRPTLIQAQAPDQC